MIMLHAILRFLSVMVTVELKGELGTPEAIFFIGAGGGEGKIDALDVEDDDEEDDVEVEDDEDEELEDTLEERMPR